VSTRDDILDAALTLFNEQGTAAVSTNHIAAAIEISPGNLYYHFRNKEDIIWALFARLYAEWEETFQLPPTRAPTVADLEGLIAENYQLIWQYRFVYRELAALLRSDPALHARYREMRRTGYDRFARAIGTFAAAGILTRPKTPQELRTLTELCWMVSEQWPVNLELSGQALDEASIAQGIALLRHVLRPYLPGKGREARRRMQ
jgi:AcrR family transcriptional regulator